MKPHPARFWASLCGGAALLLSTGCNSASTPSGQAANQGEVLQDPNSSLNALGLPYSFFVDDNASGAAPELRIAGLQWGRLVDVYGLNGPVGDPESSQVLMQEEFVVGGEVGLGSNPNYELSRNAVTGVEQLLILADVSEASASVGEAGRDRFFRLLAEAEEELTPIFDTASGGADFFTFVPRNAAIVIQFSDLLDPETVSSETIKVLTGVPAEEPFLTNRILIDRNHGDLSSNGGGGTRFFTTRVIVDPTVSSFESFDGDSDDAIPVSLTGLPPSVNVSQANVTIRIPTRTNPLVGQEILLQNLTEHELTVLDNGSFDFGSSTLDVTRAFRSGGNANVTGDAFNGYLRDDDSPGILGSQLAAITALPIQDPNDPFAFTIPSVEFVSQFCGQDASPGDVIQQPGLFLEVTTANVLANNALTDVGVRFLSFPDEWESIAANDDTIPNAPAVWLSVALAQLQYLSTYDEAVDSGREACFLSILPLPSDFAASPATGLSTASTISVRFTEPMEISSVTPFDGITLTRVAEPTSGAEYVVGELEASNDRSTFTFVPSLPLSHTEGLIESFFWNLSQDAFAPLDLSGNALGEQVFEQVELSVEPAAQSVVTNGRAIRFSGPDEEAPFGDDDLNEVLPEWSGQHAFDLARQVIRPRPVDRFQATVDRLKPSPAAWTPYSNTSPLEPPIREPLIPEGARLQTLWRVTDLGLGLQDSNFYNIDVEELAWAPLGGDVLADVFSEFEISLAHSARLPDEFIDPTTGALLVPNSGLLSTFANNLLDQVGEPLTVVHPGFEGYVIEPAASFQTGNDQVLMPFPVNRGGGDARFFTWRNTDITARGGDDAAASPPRQWLAVTGQAPFNFYSAGEMQSVALPLLMDFKCFPTDQGIGQNLFDVARVSAISATNPVTRAFASGGFIGDLEQTVDPNLTDEATGGFNPFSTPPGAATPGSDNLSYFGGVDFVVRISRSSSVWYPVRDAGNGPLGQANLLPAVVVPSLEDQPLGTRVELDYRGATSIANPLAEQDASTIDAYGDFQAGGIPFDSGTANQGISFLDGDSAWVSDATTLEGAQYFQLRLTFVANPESGQVPEVASIGVAWTD